MSDMNDAAANESHPKTSLQNPQNDDRKHLSRDAPADYTASKQRGCPFLPEQSGNLSGRPKGKRNKLTALFIGVVENDFSANGAEALAKLRESDPASYIRLIASIIPRELILEEEKEINFSELSADEIQEVLMTARKNLSYHKMVEEFSR